MNRLVRNLAKQTGMLENDIERIIRTAPVRYKRYQIPKRNGQQRQISQPARELKALQRAVLEIYLGDLPIHSAATAYRKGFSIKDNALPHAMNGPILKLDFENFFPSIRAQDWRLYCERNQLFDSPEEIYQSSLIFFQKIPKVTDLRLAIGAPSSPMLSNLLMFEFDSLISRKIVNENVVYTRYADDVTFSAPRTGYLVNVEQTVKRVLKGLHSPSLKLNDTKKVVATKKYRRSVTGLILTNDGNVSIGRDQKRKIRASIHHFQLKKLSDEETQKLAGLLAYVNAVERKFLDKMIATYGKATIDALRKFQPDNISHHDNIPF